MNNDLFAKHAWYFRNALVRANYNDLTRGIHQTSEYLELFLRNLLLNEQHSLQNRALHIYAGPRALEKANIKPPEVNIATEKANIRTQKANIEIQKANTKTENAATNELPASASTLTAKTAAHVQTLRAQLGQAIFGRTDVQRLLKLKPTRSSALLRDLVTRQIIAPVTGHGKGKYRFRVLLDLNVDIE